MIQIKKNNNKRKSTHFIDLLIVSKLYYTIILIEL